MEFPRKGGAGIRPIQNKLFPDETNMFVFKSKIYVKLANMEFHPSYSKQIISG